MSKERLKKIILFFLISIGLELLVFNYRAILSLNATNQPWRYEQYGNVVFAGEMSGEPGYVYLDVESCTDTGAMVPVMLKISICDEGNSQYYALEDVTIYPLVEKSKYIKINSYGAIKEATIEVEPKTTADVYVRELTYDAKVPWFVSVPRMLILFVILCMAYALRPEAGVYTWKWTSKQKYFAVGALIVINSVFFLATIRSNPAFLNPVWPYHQQYHQLAVSLSEGKTSIDVGDEETHVALQTLENPYDYAERVVNVPRYDAVWDTCYYQGEFYVYFGIVPVLLFYLPYYMLFHSAFPTWLGVYIAGVGCIAGVYYLLRQVCKKWFSELSYTLYLILAVIGSNSLNLFYSMLSAEFYNLPIVMALCFSLWGIGLLISATNYWEQDKKGVNARLAIGALCMALTAGCRPQFLVGSILVVPVLLPYFLSKRKEKKTIISLLAFALPYIIVAIGLMYYNYIRFGSVFDFGANYNLTTNDMTRRGFSLERLPDGIFMYLFQPFSIHLQFPFVEVTPFYSGYLGNTIKEWTYGGVLWTHPILLSLLGMGAVKQELREKRLYKIVVLCICMALLVICADTQMAGILHRYYTDFLWLLMIASMIVVLQILEKYKDTPAYNIILKLVLIAAVFGMLFEIGATFRGSGIMNDNMHRYYLIKSLFQ